MKTLESEPGRSFGICLTRIAPATSRHVVPGGSGGGGTRGGRG